MREGDIVIAWNLDYLTLNRNPVLQRKQSVQTGCAIERESGLCY